MKKYPSSNIYLNLFLILLTALYLICMIVVPVTSGSWEYVQNVWDRWQSFNVGMIAFLSSVIAFGITKYNAEQQRKREFASVRPLLPLTLSEILEYIRSCADHLRIKRETNNLDPTDKYIKPPSFPVENAIVFEKCIRHATFEIGDYLATILNELQLLNSRLNSSYRGSFISLNNNMVYTYRTAEIYIMVQRSFAIGRGKKDLNLNPPNYEDFEDAYNALNVNFSDNNVELLKKTTLFLRNNK